MEKHKSGTYKLFRLASFIFQVFFTSLVANGFSQSEPLSFPTAFHGQLTDCETGELLSNAIVTAFSSDTLFTTQTDGEGNYSLLVIPDTFDLVFKKFGYYTDTVFNQIAIQGKYTEVNTSLCDFPIPPDWVFLDPNEADTEALIKWVWNYSGFEIAYDDGSAEDYSMWVEAGGKSAVRFTPPGYPVNILSGQIYVGDGSFPVGADFLGTDFAIGILDDDGPGGMPGTVLDSIIVTVNNYHWVQFDGFNTTIEEGDFYMVMWQLGVPPEAAPIGIDTDLPTVYRSYIAQAGTDWMESPYQDFMMRVRVVGSNILETEKRNPGDFPTYDLVWIDGFDPNNNEGPELGSKHHWPNNEYSPHIDSDWGPRPPGFYAYAVRSNYETDTSDWTYSNIAAHRLDNEVTILVECCDDSIPDNIEVLLIGKQYPYQQLQGVATVIPSDNQARMVFDSVIDGAYDLTVFKVGYQEYFHFDIQIFNNYNEFVVLQENAFPPTNLYVDSLTSVATWDPALITQLPLEDFEGEEFPPEGWQNIAGDLTGWLRSNDGGFSQFPIPPGDGYYAVDVTNTYGSGPGGENDYLITPMMDLRSSGDFTLQFDHYFTGAFGETAEIRYSTDNGATWEVYHVIQPVEAFKWEHLSVDLSPFSGVDGLSEVWFAFFASDNGDWASGWAVDNALIHGGPAPIRGYYVYLDDSFVAETAVEPTSYTYTDLVYGQNYKASIRTAYTCILSNPIHYYFTSNYLYPPRYLHNTYQPDSSRVPLSWLPPQRLDSLAEVPEGLLGFKVYKDSLWMADVAYNGEGVDDTIQYTTEALDPACYALSITANYDLTPFGFPGQTGESYREGPDTVCLFWGYELPFFEEWNDASFNANGWRLEGNGWRINEEVGREAPSASFDASELINFNNYSTALTSNPIKAVDITYGEIFLDFQVKLEDVNPTGNEKLSIEITNNAGSSWYQIAEFTNENGGFSFEDSLYHFDIQEYALGNIFQFRFTANGLNAHDISAWYVDNIHVYSICEPPTHLSGSYFWHPPIEDDNWGVEICWLAPELPQPPAIWLYWDNNEFTGGVGLTDGRTFSVAQRWDAGQLYDWNGENLSGSVITKIAILLNNTTFDACILKIWSGSSAENLIFEHQLTNPIAEQWIEIVLNDTVAFDVNEELWVGYTLINQISGSFPAGYDEGPAVTGYGDMITTNGTTWDKVSELGVDKNWLVHVFVEELPSEGIQQSLVEKTVYNENSEIRSQAAKSEIEPHQMETESFGLTGFNLYRKEIGVNEDFVLYSDIPYVEGQLEYCYYDKYPNVNVDGSYYYKVTSSWENGNYFCQSKPALNIPETEDYVYITVSDIPVSAGAEINIYPNPARDQLHISSNDPIEKISIFNASGNLVFEKDNLLHSKYTINTERFPSGVYLMKIKTEKGIISKKVVINQ